MADGQAYLGTMDEIVSLYYADIYRFCYWKLRGQEAAGDVTQDTFIRFMDAAKTYADIEKPKALLYTIAGNLCRNQRRRVQPVSLDAPEQSGALVAEGFADAAVERLDLADALSQLPEEQQEVLLLRYGQELKVGEIAEILGLSRFQVMYRIRGGLDRLRKQLGKEA